MKVIEPISVTDANLTSSTIAEDDYPAWDGVTTYAIGDRRIYGHVIYESLTSNTNKQPDQNPLDWLNVGATNRWRMFDAKVGTQSTATTSMTVVITPGYANALALVNVDGAFVDVTMTAPAYGTVYSKTFRIADTLRFADWYSYFTDSIAPRRVLVVSDLPMYLNGSVSITVLRAEGETVSLGALVIGKYKQWGIRDSVLAGVTTGIQDYSRKQADDFGNYSVVERAFAKRARWSIILTHREIDAFQASMANVRAKPAVFIGSPKYDSTIVYGFYRDFSVVIPSSKYAECSVELEGLI